MAYDPSEELAVLRDDLDRLQQDFGAAEEASRKPVTEYDRTGTVTVELDADARLQRIKIAGSWNRHLQPHQLGAAVQEAFVAAGLARTHAWGEKIADQRPASRARPAEPPSTALAAQLDSAQERGVDTDEVLRALRDMLREFNESIDAVSEQADAMVAAEYSGRSTSGHATAVVGGTGDLLQLEFSPGWVETAHPTNLGREATEAVLAAQRARGESTVQDLIENSPIGEARRLGADPLELARRLGLG
ncbi:hypothetical protein ACXR2U_10230 [Jatrophihabitans sp. YIM 134969]